MKKIIVASALLFALFFPGRAQWGMATDGVIWDTVVTVNGHLFDVREITRGEFYRLYRLHPTSSPRYRVIGGISNIRAALEPEYEFFFEGTALMEIRRDGETIYENPYLDDCFDEEYTHFYPDLGLILYIGGHESGQAFNVYTGRHDSYDPAKTISSADGQFRLASIMSGQDGDEFWIDVYRAGKGEYECIAHLYDIQVTLGYNEPRNCLEGIHYMRQEGGESFWIGNSLYFRNPYGGRCMCITVEI